MSSFSIHSFSSNSLLSIPQQTKPCLTKENPLIHSISQKSLNQQSLAYASALSLLSEKDKDWVIISTPQEKAVETFFNDSQKLQTLLDILAGMDSKPFLDSDANLDSEEWVLVNSYECEEIKVEEKEKSWLTQWFITTSIPCLAIAAGTLKQLSKSKASFSIFQSLYFLKQVEIKNGSFVLPNLPLFIDLAAKVYEDNSNDSFQLKVIKAVLSLNKKKMVFSLLSLGLNLTTGGMSGTILKAGLVAFDVSGHIMTKAVNQAYSAKGLTNNTHQKSSSFLRQTALYSSVASDAFKLYKTTQNFHTVEEMAAGALWGILNLGVAKALLKR